MFKTLLVISILSVPTLIDVIPPPPPESPIFEIQLPEEEIRKLIREELNILELTKYIREQQKIRESQESEKLTKEKLKYFRA